MELESTLRGASGKPGRAGGPSRRHAFALLLGAGASFSRVLTAAEGQTALRLAISESLVADVNLNDARAAMSIWLKRIAQEMNIVVDYNPMVFDTTEEILRRVRGGQLDAVAFTVIEYRQVADLLDSTQLVAESGAAGAGQYIMLAKQSGGIQKLADLRGRRLIMLRSSKMCVAPAWLTTLLDEAHLGQSEAFFGGVTSESKISRVILPVFFGQADACVATKWGFETLCMLNPQVGRDLRALATSPVMVVTFYVFRKGYQGLSRERFVKAISSLPSTVSGRQLATLFQFEELKLTDTSCLTNALNVLEKAERIRNPRGAGKARP